MESQKKQKAVRLLLRWQVRPTRARSPPQLYGSLVGSMPRSHRVQAPHSMAMVSANRAPSRGRRWAAATAWRAYFAICASPMRSGAGRRSVGGCSVADRRRECRGETKRLAWCRREARENFVHDAHQLHAEVSLVVQDSSVQEPVNMLSSGAPQTGGHRERVRLLNRLPCAASFFAACSRAP